MEHRFSHAFIAGAMLRQAAKFYRATGQQHPQQMRRMMIEADICDQVAAMIETAPTGGCDRLPQPSFQDDKPFYTPRDQVRNGWIRK